MLEIDRMEKILSELGERKRITYKELEGIMDVSLSTIKRDIEKMEHKGLLNKIKGGISQISDIKNDKNVEERFVENINEKKEIAIKALRTIKNNEFIYLDAGTTVFYLINKLKNKNVTVVTNGLMHIEELTRNKIRTIIIGGEVKDTTRAIVGAEAIESLEKYRFDRCFIGVNGIDEKKGFTTPELNESIIKKRVLELSEFKYILADKTKFNKISNIQFAKIGNCKIITSDESIRKNSKYKKYFI